jgi:hypothetical protein
MASRALGVLLAGTVVWWAAAPSAQAQAVYGSIAGSVTDTTGAALPGVAVTITSVERKTVDVVQTNESGIYARTGSSPAPTR